MHRPADDRKGPPDIYAVRAPADPGQPLAGDAVTGVAVIGGGLTGLSTALHLAEAGAQVMLVEAHGIGWGASGRAFGQLVPYLKRDEGGILAHYGPERGERIVDAIGKGPDLVFDLIARLGISCDVVRTGLLFGAHSAAGQRSLERRAACWQERGVPLSMLDRSAAAAAIGGAPIYGAAMLDPRGGHLNPLALARGLAVAAARAGAAIHSGTTVRGIVRRGDRWRLTTDRGVIAAEAVVIATNAYSGELWPGLRRCFIPMRGHGLVSVPIEETRLRNILPGGQPLTDTRRLFSGVRLLPGGRLHVSLDGPYLGRERGPYLASADARVARLFPDLGPVAWQESWSGWVAMTTDHFPHVHEPAPGLLTAYGYNGRGIVAAIMIGAELAKRLGGTKDAELVFPSCPMAPVRGHGLVGVPLRLLVNGYRLLDRWDDRRTRKRRRTDVS